MIELIELHALADGELAGDREKSLRAWVAEDSEASVELQAIVTMKVLLRERVEPVKCEAEWKACAARLNELHRVRRIERVVSSRLAWGLSGILFATILAAGLMHRGTDSTKTSSSELAQMISVLQPAHDSGTTTSKDATRLANALLNLSNRSLDSQRMELRGRSYGELDGRVVNVLRFRDASGDLAVIVVPDVLQIDGMGNMRRDHSFHLGHVEAMNSVAWTDGRNTILLVADRPYEDLVTTATAFESSK